MQEWASFGEDLRQLADKAYPDLQEEVRERFAHNQYLARLDKPQVAFSVRQAKPETVDEAVKLTLEMESYLQAAKQPSKLAMVELESSSHPRAEPISAIQPKKDSIQLLLDRMDQLESKLQNVMASKLSLPKQKNFHSRPRSRYRSGCWNCGEESHISRSCPKPQMGGYQPGNEETLSAVSQACSQSEGSQPSSTPKFHDNMPTFSISHDSNYVLEGSVNGVPASILADTGAAVTVMSREFWDKSKTNEDQLREATGKKLVGVQGTPLQLYGVSQVTIVLVKESFPTEVIVTENLTTDIVLGRDFLRDQQCTIKMGKKGDVLHLNDKGVAVTLNGDFPETELSCVGVIIDKTIQVPPQSIIEVMRRIPCSNYISHRPGQKHQNIDSLSCRPCTQCGRENHDAPVVAAIDQVDLSLVETTPKEMRQNQLDAPIQLFLQAKEKNEKPSAEDIRSQGPIAQHLSQLWNRLIVKQGILFRQYEDVNSRITWLQLVVPYGFREKIMQDSHA